jgi:hypothetical protein
VKRFGIAALVPPLTGPALVMLVSGKLLGAELKGMAAIFIFGGGFTLCFSLPYAFLLETFYGWSKTGAGTIGGAIATIVLGFFAGVGIALFFSNLFAGGARPSLRIEDGMLAGFGGVGTVVGVLVAILVFIAEKRSHAAR